MLGACGQVLKPAGSDLLSINGAQQTAQGAGQPAMPQASIPADPEELRKATEYWGKAYAQSPRDLQAALNYARNLKAMGEKRRALGVLQQAGLYHSESRELAGEYGRLALDFDQVRVAKQLLAMADDPSKPDWRIVSARGAALAKEGNYSEAIPLFERALALSQSQPSVLSNLALAYAMNGEPNKAESMLRQAAATDNNSPRIRQNLALVLGLQGKYDEAKLVAARDIPMTNAAENADFLRQVVKLDPKSVPNSDPLPAEWDTKSKIAEAPVAEAVPVQKIADVQPMPLIDAMARHDTAWVVSSEVVAPPAPAQAEPVTTADPKKVMSVAEMAAQFAVEEDSEPPAKPKKTAAALKPAAKTVADTPVTWMPMVAQVKR
jgi:Flp pilus assembly protein TadD